MTALIASYLPQLIAGFVALLGLAGIYLHIKATGKAEARSEQAEAEKKARDVADQVDNDIGTVPPSQQRDELKEWGHG